MSRGSMIRRIIGAAVISAVLVLVTVGSMASQGSEADLSYRSLDYQATVLSNGDLRVVQTIDVHLRDRDEPWRQLYQDYQIKPSNLTAITDVSVRNLSTGTDYSVLTNPRVPSDVPEGMWDSTQAGHWYMADVTQGDDSLSPYDPSSDTGERTVEVGWNIPATDSASSMRFRVSMTFVGVATAHPDVASLKWEPFGQKNQTPIGKVTGSVSFPEGIDSSNSWAWLHFDGTSTTSRASDGSLRFSADDVRAGQYLDVVAMFDVSAAKGVARTDSTDAKQRIIDDETQQESEWRESQRRAAIRRIVLVVVFAVAGLAAIVVGLVLARRSRRQASYQGDLDYWRDPPDLSPASAASMLVMVNGEKGKASLQNRQMSSTVLSLVSKGAISLLPGSDRLYRGLDPGRIDASTIVRSAARSGTGASRDAMTMAIMPVCRDNRESLALSQSEDAVLRLLETAAGRLGTSVFDFASLRRAFKGWKDGYKVSEDVSSAMANEFALLGATRSIGGGAVLCGVLGVACAVALAMQGSLAVVVSLAAPVLFLSLCVIATSRTKGLTVPEGQRLAGQVLGLRRYLEDFSDFTDRGAADLVLWDRYLVYAAAFGISEKALRQLALAYPELSDGQWLDQNASGSLIYWSYRPWAFQRAAMAGGIAGTAASIDPSAFSATVGDIGSQISSSFSELRSTIAAARPSSSGSGGSFSGGGFGGSGGGSGGGSFGGR